MQPLSARCMLTLLRLRMGTHSLRTMLGRRPRFQQWRLHAIRDEMHLVVECPAVQCLRDLHPVWPWTPDWAVGMCVYATQLVQWCISTCTGTAQCPFVNLNTGSYPPHHRKRYTTASPCTPCHHVSNPNSLQAGKYQHIVTSLGNHVPSTVSTLLKSIEGLW